MGWVRLVSHTNSLTSLIYEAYDSLQRQTSLKGSGHRYKGRIVARKVVSGRMYCPVVRVLHGFTRLCVKQKYYCTLGLSTLRVYTTSFTLWATLSIRRYGISGRTSNIAWVAQLVRASVSYFQNEQSRDCAIRRSWVRLPPRALFSSYILSSFDFFLQKYS